MRGNINGEMAASARLVFDNDLLPPDFREPIGNDARADIGPAARRKSDQQPHRTCRVDLRVSGAGHRRKHGSPRRNM